MVYEYQSQIFSPIGIERDRNNNNLDRVDFKLITAPGDLCSREPCAVDLCRDQGIRTGKELLDRAIIRIRYSTVQHHSGISGLGLAWITGRPILELVIASCGMARG
jgi:hypothetical protein